MLDKAAQRRGKHIPGSITWNVIGALGVNVTRNVFAELGYRYMYVDSTSDSFLYQMSSYGIYSSLGFKF